MRPLGLLALPVALVTAVTLAGCGSTAKDGDIKADPTSTTSSKPAEPEHRISVTFDDPQDTPDTGYIGTIVEGQSTPEAYAQFILKQGALTKVAEGFSDTFAFPTDLKIEVHSGDGSPFYDPQTKTVNLFYSFAILTADILKADHPKMSDNELGKEWEAVNDFVLIHELGHAFVDVFDLPIVTDEEGAVDGLASYFFTNEVEHGDEYAYDAANFFRALQNYQGDPDVTQYADEHPLSIQRYFTILCQVAGSSDADMQIIARTGELPDARLQRCPDEFRQNTHAWETLLAPHFRPGQGPSATSSPSADGSSN